MGRTNAPYSSFSICCRGRFGVNPTLTLPGLGSRAAGDLLARLLLRLKAERPPMWPFSLVLIFSSDYRQRISWLA
jgi:hypothetical protein